MKRVLVTGAAGFIGSHLCTKLLEEDVEVVGIDGSSSTEKLDYIGRNANFELINQRIEQADLPTLLKKVDVVFHLACDIKPTEEWRSIESRVRQHIQCLRKLTEAINHKKTKLIFSSSYDVYGKKTGTVSETSSANPETMFGLIKLTEENFIKQAAAKKKFAYTILRFPTIYGPWQPDEMTFQQIINAKEEAATPLTIKKDSITEDAIYVDDAVRALCLAASKETRNTVYNIGSGGKGEWRRGLKVLSIEEEDMPNEKRNMVVKGERASEELGFRSNVKIEEGLIQQIKHASVRRKSGYET